MKKIKAHRGADRVAHHHHGASSIHACQSASKRDPFVERCDGYSSRAVRAGCGVGPA